MRYNNPKNPYNINEDKIWNWYELIAHGWRIFWNDSGEEITIHNLTHGDGNKQRFFSTDIDKWDKELKQFMLDYFEKHKEELLEDPLRFMTGLSPTWRTSASENDRPLTPEDMPPPEWIKRISSNGLRII